MVTLLQKDLILAAEKVFVLAVLELTIGSAFGWQHRFVLESSDPKKPRLGLFGLQTEANWSGSVN